MSNRMLATGSNRQAGGAAVQGDSAVGQQLLPLASKSARGSSVPAALELDDGRIVLVERDLAYLVKVTRAPDGEYALLRAGRVVVQSGRATAVIGQPAAPALTASSD